MTTLTPRRVRGPWIVSSESFADILPLSTHQGVLWAVEGALDRGDRMITVREGKPHEDLLADVCQQCYEPHHLCCCSHED